MYIDIHAHVRLTPVLREGKRVFLTAEQLIRKLDDYGIDRAVLLPTVSPECLQPQSVAEILLAATAYPDRFIPFCSLDPRANGNRVDTDFAELLNDYQEQGCRGVGEITANLPFDHPKTRNMLRQVEAAGLPLLFHLSTDPEVNYGLYDDPGLPRLERALNEFPRLKLLGHSQAFWAEMTPFPDQTARQGYPAGRIEAEGRVQFLMRRYPNLYGDLSAGSGFNALARDREYAANFLTEFQDRLLFGTDFGTPEDGSELPALLESLRDSGAISSAVFEKIAAGNAGKLLDL